MVPWTMAVSESLAAHFVVSSKLTILHAYPNVSWHFIHNRVYSKYLIMHCEKLFIFYGH